MRGSLVACALAAALLGICTSGAWAVPSRHGKRVHKATHSHAESFQRFRALHKDEADKEDAAAKQKDEAELAKSLDLAGANGTAAALNGTAAPVVSDAEAAPEAGNASESAAGNATATAAHPEAGEGNATEVKMSAEDLAIANGEQLVFDDKKRAGPELPNHCKDHDITLWDGETEDYLAFLQWTDVEALYTLPKWSQRRIMQLPGVWRQKIEGLCGSIDQNVPFQSAPPSRKVWEDDIAEALHEMTVACFHQANPESYEESFGRVCPQLAKAKADEEARAIAAAEAAENAKEGTVAELKAEAALQAHSNSTAGDSEEAKEEKEEEEKKEKEEEEKKEKEEEEKKEKEDKEEEEKEKEEKEKEEKEEEEKKEKEEEEKKEKEEKEEEEKKEKEEKEEEEKKEKEEKEEEEKKEEEEEKKEKEEKKEEEEEKKEKEEKEEEDK